MQLIVIVINKERYMTHLKTLCISEILTQDSDVAEKSLFSTMLDRKFSINYTLLFFWQYEFTIKSLHEKLSW